MAGDGWQAGIGQLVGGKLLGRAADAAMITKVK